jgi:hypothetical protein
MNGLLWFDNLIIKPSIVSGSGMVHPGMPVLYVEFIFVAMCLAAVGLLVFHAYASGTAVWMPLHRFRLKLFAGTSQTRLKIMRYTLLAFKVFFVLVFILIVVSGLFGKQLPERNFATTITWTLWWTLIIISIVFVGTAWCSVCPWDTISSWLVKRKIWARTSQPHSLGLNLPKPIRGVHVATALFLILTWFELGVGITASPFATAVLALVMVLLATVSLMLYSGKAFCVNFCPVGHTIGYYSEMSAVKVGSFEEDKCASCETMECYRGSESIEACPAHLVAGKSKQMSSCTSCANCFYSCPKQNVSWVSRMPGQALIKEGKLNRSEELFVLVLMSTTFLHGLTMLPFWKEWVESFALIINDSGIPATSFSLFMVAVIFVCYVLTVLARHSARLLAGKVKLLNQDLSFFSLAFIPTAFAYHIAHNLTHLFRETQGIGSVLLNPLAIDADPISNHEKHMRHMNPVVDEGVIFVAQGLLIFIGFWIAARIIQARIRELQKTKQAVSSLIAVPLYGVLLLFSTFSLWLLMQPMVMRF